jgi:predicted MPP superfamily phosphohydrolase
VLLNEARRITIGDRSILLGGVELKFASDASQRLVRNMEDSAGDADIRILLTHRPDVALGLKEHSRIDLVIAGHTHGGQVVVPLFGPPMTLSKIPRHMAAGGLHRINENLIYISRGVGCERAQAPRIRFLCPPEISILTVGSETKNR